MLVRGTSLHGLLLRMRTTRTPAAWVVRGIVATMMTVATVVVTVVVMEVMEVDECVLPTYYIFNAQ